MPSGALDYITIKGFKSIAAVERLPLRALNLLIGPNGSGKSNFIGVFEFLYEISQNRLQAYVARMGGAEKILHFGSKTTKHIVFQLSFHNEADQFELRLSPTADDRLLLSPNRGPNQELLPWLLERGTDWDSLGRRLETSRPYHFHDTSSSSLMRKTAKVDDNRFLRADGSNLAAFLYYLQEKHYESYGLIQRTVQRVAPFFIDFQLKPLNLQPDDIKLEWRHKRSDRYFDASSLSDGTLRFIGLATLFLQPKEHLPSVLVVDEPELGLHPLAIEMLASLMRQASVNTQVIVSTQSSLLLDYFDPEDVLVADRVDGATQITRLESARLAAWLADYSLGQLWEKNEIGGRPVRD
jgi:predicted ATPase